MMRAGVRFGYPNGGFLGEAHAKADGSFELRIDKPGLFILQFAAVQHEPRTRAAVYFTGESDVRVKAILGTPTYTCHFQN